VHHGASEVVMFFTTDLIGTALDLARVTATPLRLVPGPRTPTPEQFAAAACKRFDHVEIISVDEVTDALGRLEPGTLVVLTGAVLAPAERVLEALDACRGQVHVVSVDDSPLRLGPTLEDRFLRLADERREVPAPRP
jgi:hypothetical protein